MLSSSRPYLIRAIYDWLVDNKLTPYIIVDVRIKGVKVPNQFVNGDQIVLNVIPQAVRDLIISNHKITFNARFSGVPQEIIVPIQAVQAIYAFENGRGMLFDHDDELLDDFDVINHELGDMDSTDDDDDGSSGGGKKTKKPSHLRIVK